MLSGCGGGASTVAAPHGRSDQDPTAALPPIGATEQTLRDQLAARGAEVLKSRSISRLDARWVNAHAELTVKQGYPTGFARVSNLYGLTVQGLADSDAMVAAAGEPAVQTMVSFEGSLSVFVQWRDAQDVWQARRELVARLGTHVLEQHFIAGTARAVQPLLIQQQLQGWQEAHRVLSLGSSRTWNVERCLPGAGGQRDG